MSATAKSPGHKADMTYWLIAYLAYMLLPFVGELSWWFFLLFAIIAGWRILIARFGWSQPGTLSRTALALLLFLIIYKTQGGVLGRDSGVALLIVMLSLKLLELRSYRDYMIAALLGLLLLLGNFLFSQSLPLTLYLLGGVVFAFSCLYRINFANNIGARQRFTLSGQLLLLSIPLMLVLYFVFPRLPVGLFALPSASSGITGLSETMSPGSINNLTASDKPVYYAEFNNSQRIQGPFYWRTILLWHFDGRTWQRHPPVHDSDYNIRTTSRPLEYEIIMEQEASWIPSLDIAIKGPPRSSRLAGLVYRWPLREVKRRRYKLTSARSYEYLDLYPSEKPAALQLPAVSNRVRHLVKTWRRAHRSDRAVVNAALQYFTNNEFYYTLTPPLLGGDPVDEFLFDRRQGFCEHFSSAFVVLMRQAGIPARVVTGFLGAEYNQGGGFYTIRQSDAHAWAEVWLPGSGWTRVDPTSAVAPERIEYGIDAIRRLQQEGINPGDVDPRQLAQLFQSGLFSNLVAGFRQQWELINVNWYRWTEGFDSERQARFLRSLNISSTWITYLAAIAVAVLLTGFTAAFLLITPRRRNPVTRLYRKFCKLFAARGLSRIRHEGPLDYGNRLVRAYPGLSRELNGFIMMYIDNRYGTAADDIKLLRQRYRQLANAVKANT